MKSTRPRALFLLCIVLAWLWVACAPPPAAGPVPAMATVRVTVPPAPTSAPSRTATPAPTTAPTAALPSAAITSILIKPIETGPVIAAMRFPFSAANLQSFQPAVMDAYKLNAGAISYSKTVGFALPMVITTTNPIVLMNSPLKTAPTRNTQEFATKSIGIGTLVTGRALPLAGRTAGTPAGTAPELKAGTYVVAIEKDEVFFVDSANNKVSAGKAQLRTIAGRVIESPETIITVKDICWAWQTDDRGAIQVCTEASLRDALEKDGTYAILTKEMEVAVDDLVGSKLLKKEEINWKNGTIADLEGTLATEKQRASFLAAPVVRDPSPKPADGALLGAVQVSLEIDLKHPNGSVSRIPPGAYAVRLYEAGSKHPYVQFFSADSKLKPIQAAAEEVQRRGVLPGQTEEPLAIIYHWCFLCWCMPPD